MKLLFLAGSLIAGLVSAQDGYFALCSTDNNCGNNGTCVIDQCQCDDGFRSIIGQVPCSVNDSACNTTATVDQCNSDKSGGFCQNTGVCKCSSNFLDGLGQCSVSMNCDSSAAQVQCSGNGICQGGTCICNLGYHSVSAACDTKSTACLSDAYCSHGSCNTASSQCVCDTNWSATKSLLCDTCLNDSVCGHGRCDGLKTGICTCDAGWVKGADHVCNIWQSPACTKTTDCGHGKCTSGACVCDATYESITTPCDQIIGDCGSAGYGNYCEHSGTCKMVQNAQNVLLPNCTCSSQWYGDRCESENFCNGNICPNVNETCVIKADFSGSECLNTGDICPSCNAAFAMKFSAFVITLRMMF